MAAICKKFCFLFLYFITNKVLGEVKVLNDDTFEHLTQASTGATTGDWLILFSKPHDQCEKCKAVEELFNNIHDQLKSRMNVAKVLQTGSKLTVKRFGISEWPAVIFLKQGVVYQNQDKELTEEKIVQFAQGSYDKASQRRVPEPITKFDLMLEDIYGDFQHVMRLRKNAAIIIFLIGVVFGLCLTPLLTCIANYLVNTFMDEGDMNQGGQLSSVTETQLLSMADEEGDEKAKTE